MRGHEDWAESEKPDADAPAGGEAPCALPRFAEMLGYDEPEGPSRMEGDALHYALTVGIMEAELLLPLCRSLKDKRGILAKTMAHLRKKHGVSVAEVAKHDTWGRAGLAIVTVSGDQAVAEKSLRAVARTLERDREVQLVHWSVELM